MRSASILQALAKDYLRRCWWCLLFAAGILVLGPLAFIEFMLLDGLAVTESEVDPLSYYDNYLGIALFGFTVASCASHEGIPRRLRGSPVSSWFAMGWLMGSTAASVVVMSVVTTSSYRMLFGVEWPILEPTVIFLVAVLVGQCGYWNLHAFGFRRLAAWIGVIGLMIWWAISHLYPDGLWQPMQPLHALTPIEVLAMAVITGCAYLVAVRSFSSYRCGAASLSPGASRFDNWLSTPFVERFRSESFPFHSPLAALQWFNARATARFSMVALIPFAGFALFVSTQVLSQDNTRRSAIEGIVAMLMLIPALAGFGLGTLLGLDALTKSRFEMPRYLGVCPLTDKALSAAFVRNAMKTTVVGWMVVATTLLLPLAWLSIIDNESLQSMLDRFWLTSQFRLWGIAAAVVGSLAATWIALGSMAALRWTGRPWLTAAAVVAICFPMIALLLSRFFLPRDIFELLTRLVIWSFAVAAMLGTAIAFGSALRRGLVAAPTSATVILACALAAVVCCSVAAPVSVEHRVAACGLLALAAAPFATGPLAIAWNRHR